jgi:hypothetical protein
MSPVFRECRRHISKHLLELQASRQENLDKLLHSASRKISHPTRAFAMKIARGDAKVAAKYCSSSSSPSGVGGFEDSRIDI